MTDEIKFEKKLGNASASDAAAKSSMLRFFQKKKLAVGVAARGAVSLSVATATEFRQLVLPSCFDY